MLTRIELYNFQAHEKLDLPLGRLTCFTGPSNSGKSAVLRAIAGLLRNDAVGPYVREGAKDLKVVLHRDDGLVVEWTKGKTPPAYKITYPDGSVKKLPKVGANVPVEVSEALCMGDLTLEDGKTKVSVNLHEQADKPFLVFDTGGQVAKVMGELTSAGKLFSAAAEGNRRTKADKKRKDLRQEDIDKLTTELSSYAGLDDLTEKMGWVETKLTEADGAEKAASELESLLTNLASLENELSLVNSSMPPLEKAATLDLKQLSALQSAVSSLGTLDSALKSAEEGLTASANDVSRLSVAKTADLSALVATNEAAQSLHHLISGLNDVLDVLDSNSVDHSIHLRAAEVDLEQLFKVQTALVSLAGLLDDLSGLEHVVWEQGVAIEDAEKALAEANEALASIDTCYTCGQSLTSDAREHMLHA